MRRATSRESSPDSIFSDPESSPDSIYTDPDNEILDYLNRMNRLNKSKSVGTEMKEPSAPPPSLEYRISQLEKKVALIWPIMAKIQNATPLRPFLQRKSYKRKNDGSRRIKRRSRKFKK